MEDCGAAVELGALSKIDAEPRQMRQQFQNLIGNALEFRHKHVPPRVRVSSRPAPDEAQREDGSSPECCEIAIADNGTGFDNKYNQQIFEIFQRLHGRCAYTGLRYRPDGLPKYCRVSWRRDLCYG